MARGNYENSAGQKGYVQPLFETSSTKKHRLGTIRVLDDGRRYVYCKATAAQIAAGICVSKAVTPQAATVTTVTDVAYNQVGSRKVTFTLTGTPTANLYEDGLLVVGASGGIGEMYKIAGNSADDIPASGRCTFELYDKLATVHDASTTVSLFQNPYKDVLINPAVADGDATTEERILGVTTRIVPASHYFWAQTWGLGTVFITASTAGNEGDERFLVAGSTAGYLLCLATEPDRVRYGSLVVGADYTDGVPALAFLEIS